MTDVTPTHRPIFLGSDVEVNLYDATMSIEERTVWGEIEGRTIVFPMVVEEMNQATLMFSVPADAAQALIPGDAFRVLDMGNGSALLVMALVDYIRNPWGDYGEVNLGLIAHPVDKPDRPGAFVYRMPVDQEFTKRAGNEVLGLPKTVEDLSFEYTPDTVTVTLRTEGADTLLVRLPRPEATEPPTHTEADTYSYLDGVPTVIPLTIDIGTGVIDPASVHIELGETTIAKELRSLGLPRTPDSAAWGEKLTGTFQLPRPV